MSFIVFNKHLPNHWSKWAGWSAEFNSSEQGPGYDLTKVKDVEEMFSHINQLMREELVKHLHGPRVEAYAPNCKDIAKWAKDGEFTRYDDPIPFKNDPIPFKSDQAENRK